MVPDQHIAADAHYDVIIIGGGMAGLVSSIVLSRAGKKVLLLEKKSYPYHKVCGEYVSNEVLPYLISLSFDPFTLGAARITKLRISAPAGKNIYAPLDLGAFALSRYTMDQHLAKLSTQQGTTLLTHTRVTDITYNDGLFTATTSTGNTFTAPFAIGSWGKRETLDKKLQRPFIEKHTRYMGVKYHIRTDYPIDEIGLDNFEGGYCGIVKIEGDKYNLCNFYRRPKDPHQHTSIRQFEETVVLKNPVIKNIFSNADFLFDAPVVINEVNFAPKQAVENHIFMCGDSAGLITPLCGNGMSMAIAGAQMLTDMLLQSGLLNKPYISNNERTKLEQAYTKAWRKQFATRLWVGRTVQGLFGNTWLTSAALTTIHAFPPLARVIIKATHGRQLSAQ